MAGHFGGFREGQFHVGFVRVCGVCGELVRDKIEPLVSFLLCFGFTGAAEKNPVASCFLRWPVTCFFPVGFVLAREAGFCGFL